MLKDLSKITWQVRSKTECEPKTPSWFLLALLCGQNYLDKLLVNENTLISSFLEIAARRPITDSGQCGSGWCWARFRPVRGPAEGTGDSSPMTQLQKARWGGLLEYCLRPLMSHAWDGWHSNPGLLTVKSSLPLSPYHTPATLDSCVSEMESNLVLQKWLGFNHP